MIFTTTFCIVQTLLWPGMMPFIRLMLLSAAPAIASMARQVNNSTDPHFPIQNVSSSSTEIIGETVGLDPETVTLTHFVTQTLDTTTSIVSLSTSDGDPSARPWDGSFETPIQPDWTSTAFETQFVTLTQEKEITTLLQTVTVSPSTRSSQIKTFGPIKPVPETIPARPPKPTTATTSEWESPDWTHHEASPAPWIEGLKKERITVEWCKDHNDKSTCDARNTVAGICCKYVYFIYGFPANRDRRPRKSLVRFGQEYRDCRGH